MNLSLPVFRTGLQRYALFFNLQIFLQLFSEKFFSDQITAPVFSRTLSLISHPFFKWECKGTTFFLISKFFRNIFTTFLTKNQPRIAKRLIFSIVTNCKFFSGKHILYQTCQPHPVHRIQTHQAYSS